MLDEQVVGAGLAEEDLGPLRYTRRPRAFAEHRGVLADEVFVHVVVLVVAEDERGLRQRLDLRWRSGGIRRGGRRLSISLSKTSATAKTCFSPMQSRLLSNAAPDDDRLRGVLQVRPSHRRRPAGCPAPRRRPAACSPAPRGPRRGRPVTTNSLTPRCSNRAAADSRVGGSR